METDFGFQDPHDVNLDQPVVPGFSLKTGRRRNQSAEKAVIAVWLLARDHSAISRVQSAISRVQSAISRVQSAISRVQSAISRSKERLCVVNSS